MSGGILAFWDDLWPVDETVNKNQEVLSLQSYSNQLQLLESI